MSFALASPVSYPLILIVAWVVLLFCGFGLTMVAAFIGACAAASAAYMILDLSSPYSSVFRASPPPLQQVLAVMGKK